jgi:hypothetical protein
MSIKTKSQVKVFQLDDNGKTGMKDIQKNILSATKKVSKKSKLKKIHYQMMKRSSCMVENYGDIFTKTGIWENENYDMAYIKKTPAKSHDFEISCIGYVDSDDIKDNYDVTYIGRISVNEEDNYDIAYVGFIFNVDNISQ